MGINRQFFDIRNGITAGDVATFLGLSVAGNPEIQISDVASVEDCDVNGICFVGEEKAAVAASTNHLGLVITSSNLAHLIPNAAAVIVADKPREFFARAAQWLVIPTTPKKDVILIDSTADVSQYAMIGNGVKIGAGSVVAAGAVIQNQVHIGDRCIVGPNAVVSHCLIGDDVVIKSGAVLGDEGFGFVMTEDGPVVMPHIGIVRIGSGSQIGANTTIDRGSLGDTIIGNNVMIDNLVHVAHNCVIGDRTIIAAQAGIAGSTVVGEGVIMGGQIGVADHLTIGSGALLTARSGITKDVAEGMKIVGFPGEEAGKYWRDQAKLRRLLRGPKKEK